MALFSNIATPRRPHPIKPEWIKEGLPTASAAVIRESHDKQSWSCVWDCTPGRFTWSYSCDETIYIVAGRVTMDDGSGPRQLGPGDIVEFVKGDVVHWHVEERVRKFAVWRSTMPRILGRALNLLRRLGLIGLMWVDVIPVPL